MTQFKPTYSSDFADVSFVENCIKLWQEGEKSFTLKTSGSTGTPKKIRLSKEMLQWSAENTYAALELQNEYILCCLPVTKTGGFMQLIRALVWDCPIYFSAPSANPLAELPHYDFTITSLTPHQVNNCIARSVNQLNSFQNILIGGAPLVEKQATTLLQVAPSTTFWETYGMTETASHIALKNLTNKNSYFTPLQGVKLSTKNDVLCIAIPELDFAITTNDMALIHTQEFEIRGRADDIINSGGIKINPTEIEPIISSLLEDNGIKNAFYLGKKIDHHLGEKMVLVMETKPTVLSLNLLEIIKTNLPQYSAPKEIHWVDQLTYTDTGKVIRTPI